MATGKRFYWIKLKKDFLTSDTIEFLMSNDRGSDYVVLYLQLCTAAINTSGRLESRIGEMIVPFDVDRIQREGRYFPLETVEKALDIYKRIGLIYEDRDGTLIIADYSDMVGSETDWAIKKRREKNRESGGESGGEIFPTESESRDKRIENRYERQEIEKRTSLSSSSMSTRTRDTDSDVDVLFRFLNIHKIKITRPDVSKVFEDGFELDAVFWMVEKTEAARPKSSKSYFMRVYEEKLEKGQTTISAIREAECDSNADFEIFDSHVEYWRKEYQRFREDNYRP